MRKSIPHPRRMSTARGGKKNAMTKRAMSLPVYGMVMSRVKRERNKAQFFPSTRETWQQLGFVYCVAWPGRIPYAYAYTHIYPQPHLQQDRSIVHGKA